MNERFDVVERARHIRQARESRHSFLPAALFGEPAWEMLLDLLISKQEGRPVALNSACIASGAPTTTAMRWVKFLQRAGLVEEQPDPKDRRRKFLVLTSLGERKVRAAVYGMQFAVYGSPPEDEIRLRHLDG